MQKQKVVRIENGVEGHMSIWLCVKSPLALEEFGLRLATCIAVPSDG